ncbi:MULTISPECIES: replicative DNA helicase [unclassified Stenotrophomonas]
MNANVADFPLESLRTLPQAVEAEQSVLGSLMLDNGSLPRVADWLKPEDFVSRKHQAIYAAILRLAAETKPFDAVTVADQFDAGEDGAPDLTDVVELASSAFSSANVVAYAEIVKGKATQRRLIEIGNELAGKGFNPEGEDASVIVAEATQALAEISSIRRGSVKGAKEIGSRWFAELQRRFENDGAPLGLLTPWAGFNRMTNGLKAGELIIVAGRPSMGKSAWAVNVAVCNALRGKRALVFNLEMTDTSIYNRGIASLADVPLSWLQKPDQEQEQYWSRVSVATKELNASGLLIDDTAGLSEHQVVARCRRERMKGPVDLVVIDHLHLMPLPGKTRETVEIGNITAGLKKLAKELNCPVVLLSQLNRALESRQNKRPQMSDLRESGNIEQDADLIVFLYRDDYYSEREGVHSPLDGFVEMIIAKQREGETGRAWGRNGLAFGRIDDYDGPEPVIPQGKPAARRGGLD